MEHKKIRTFKDKLIQKKKEILEAYTKNKAYGMEADGEGAQDIADKASNSYAKEFLFSLSNTERSTLQQVDDLHRRLLHRHTARDELSQHPDGHRERAITPSATHLTQRPGWHVVRERVGRGANFLRRRIRSERLVRDGDAWRFVA